MPTIKISIVICTHNRADLARDAIASVLEQDMPKDEYELLIVDNASTDHTHTMAQEFCGTYPNVRYILETKIGLSHARNRGWQESQGDYVGYLDDDAKAAAGWLPTAFDVATRTCPSAFGGPYYAFYQGQKPAWFKDEYASHIQGHAPRFLDEQEYLDGGNMFIRRDILKKLNGFHTSFGMQGKRLAFGEETDLFVRLRSETASAKLYYHPGIKIYHLVRPEKFNLWLAPKRYFSAGRYAHKVFSASAKSNNLALFFARGILLVLKLFKSITMGLLMRDRKRYSYFQNHLFEKTMPIFSQMGGLIESLSSSQENSL